MPMPSVLRTTVFLVGAAVLLAGCSTTVGGGAVPGTSSGSTAPTASAGTGATSETTGATRPSLGSTVLSAPPDSTTTSGNGTGNATPPASSSDPPSRTAPATRSAPPTTSPPASTTNSSAPSTPTPPPTPATVVSSYSPYAADGSLKLAIDPQSGGMNGADCDGVPAPGPGILICGITAASIKACWREPTTPSGTVWVDCVHDPRDKQVEHFQAGQFFVDKANDDPWAVKLADGSVCTIRTGGAWGPAPTGMKWSFACDGKTRALASPVNGPLVNESRPTWTAFTADADSTTPAATSMNIVTAYTAAATPPLPAVARGGSCPTAQALATLEGRQAEPGSLTCTSQWAVGSYRYAGDATIGIIKRSGSTWVTVDRETACTYPGTMPVTLWEAGCTTD
jgi:hypothetical protein